MDITILTDRCNALGLTPRTEKRLQFLVDEGLASEVSDDALRLLVEWRRVSTRGDITLPAHRFEGLSRGRGWARRGRGGNATWGERTDDGTYRVGPGKWFVGGHDGFQRKGQDVWVVRHVSAGSQTWTVAD